MLAIAAATYVLLSTGRGLDLTDESYYILSIENPWVYPATTTQFGMVYHPLYSTCSGGIACLRFANMSGIFVLAVTLVSLMLVGRVYATTFHDKMLVGLITISLSSASLLSFWGRMISPSYNSLNLQALLVVCIGLIGSIRFPNRLFAWAVLVGLGGALCFLAKPTSAAILAPATALIWLLFHKRPMISLAAASGVALACLVAAAYILDHSVPDFAERLTSGLEFAQNLGGGYDWSALLQFYRPPLSSIELGALVVAALATAVAGRMITPNSSQTAIFIAAIITMSGAGVAALLMVAPSVVAVNVLRYELFVMLLPLSIAIGIILTILGSVKNETTWRKIALVAYFCALPFVYAFGTNGNYWNLGAQAAFFWIAGALAMLRDRRSDRSPTANSRGLLIPGAAATAMVSAILSWVWVQQPYRQSEGIYRQASQVPLGMARKPVATTVANGLYFHHLRRAAAAGNFAVGDPIIDLTGKSPGAVLAIGGRGVVEAWMPGGYSGQDAYVAGALALMSCEDRERSYVLTEPGGARSISWPDALRPVTDYAVAGAAVQPASPGFRAARQILLRPKSVDIQSKCAMP